MLVELVDAKGAYDKTKKTNLKCSVFQSVTKKTMKSERFSLSTTDQENNEASALADDLYGKLASNLSLVLAVIPQCQECSCKSAMDFDTLTKSPAASRNVLRKLTRPAKSCN